MRYKVAALALAILAGACSGGNSTTITGPSPGPTPGPAPAMVNSITTMSIMRSNGTQMTNGANLTYDDFVEVKAGYTISDESWANPGSGLKISVCLGGLDGTVLFSSCQTRGTVGRSGSDTLRPTMRGIPQPSRRPARTSRIVTVLSDKLLPGPVTEMDAIPPGSGNYLISSLFEVLKMEEISMEINWSQ